MLFSELDLDPKLLQSIEETGFEQCTEVQEKTFKNTFNGQDVIIQSKTGTGKTAAFMISIFNQFTKAPEDQKKFALILAPTRELALQIEKEATLIGKYLPYKIATFYGGVGYKKQEFQLADGVDIMIATPGRLIDFIKSRKINLSEVSYFVVDEADRMFDLGFSKDIEFITKLLPDRTKRRTIFLSATINRNVKIFANRFINEPIEIDLSPDQLIVENVEHFVSHISIHEKFNFLLGIIQKKNPKNAFIFTNTKQAAVMVAEKLKLHGIPAEYIIGDLPQKKRTRIIEQIKENKIPFLVATDVAARGIHVDDLDMVINYDLPEDPENYVHRVGRTARAGKKGVAYSFVCERFVYSLEPLESLLNIKIPVYWPEEDLFVDTKGMDYSSIPSLDKNRRHTSKTTKRSQRRKERPAKPAASKTRPYDKDRKRSASKVSGTKPESAPQIKPKTVKKRKIQSPRKKHDLNKRLKMYEQKYGENFTVSSTKNTETKAKTGLFSKMKKAVSDLFKK